MIELPNFGHMARPTIWFESLDKILLVTSWTENMTSKVLFQNIFILIRARVVNFANIIKIATIFIKTTFEDSNKFLRILKKS